MSFFSLLSVEFQKVKRSKILFILLFAMIVLWIPAIINADLSFNTDVGLSPENNYLIQGLLAMAWFIYPASMVVGTLLLTQIERGNNGVLKMLALPVSTVKVSIAKFTVLLTLAAIQISMSVALYFASAAISSQMQNYNLILSPLFVLKETGLIFLSSIPMIAVFWLLSVLIRTPIFAIGIGLASIIPSVLMINTKIWFLYPMCYPFYIITAQYGKIATDLSTQEVNILPWLPVAIIITILCLTISSKRFGMAERK